LSFEFKFTFSTIIFKTPKPLFLKLKIAIYKTTGYAIFRVYFSIGLTKEKPCDNLKNNEEGKRE